VVKSGLAWIKTHTPTTDFKADYAKYHEERKPTPPDAETWLAELGK
jgi:hypothetical protein